jgi:colanic acid biosynthesis glycosyl transferase WcaI
VVNPEDPEALANAILELQANPSKAERLGRKGRQYAEERYAFEHALNQYEALFASVVKRSTSNPQLLPKLASEKF